MRRRLALAAAGLLALLAGNVQAAAPPPVTAQAYIVVSGLDGTTLAERRATEQRAVASITKLMTVLVALDHARLSDVVTVPAAAAGIGESSMDLRPGDRLTVRELALGALVPSANDAATALASHVGRGSVRRFVGMMNRKARELGLSGTQFANPHGLDEPGHHSSASDAVRLARAALRNPFIRAAAATERVSVSGGRTLVTTDELLARYAPLVGGKTGHTAQAGWSQVALARAGGVDVWATVLGSASKAARNDDLEALLRYGLAEHGRVKAIDRGRVYARATAPYGRPSVALVAPHTVVTTRLLRRPLVERVVVPSTVALPVRKGQRLGEVRVYERGKLVARSPLVAAAALEEPGRLGKVRWYATRMAHHIAEIVS